MASEKLFCVQEAVSGAGGKTERLFQKSKEVGPCTHTWSTVHLNARVHRDKYTAEDMNSLYRSEHMYMYDNILQVKMAWCDVSMICSDSHMLYISWNTRDAIIYSGVIKRALVKMLLLCSLLPYFIFVCLFVSFLFYEYTKLTDGLGMILYSK